MNTKKSKSPKRWKMDGLLKIREGSYFFGIKDQNILEAVGKFVVIWPHTEEQMQDVFRELCDAPFDFPLSQIFNSVVNARDKIAILRNLLQSSCNNKFKGVIFDELIDEFESLNLIRNQYVHGKWATHESGDIYLAYKAVDDWWLSKSRRITLKEINESIARVEKLNSLIRKDVREHMIKRLKSKRYE